MAEKKSIHGMIVIDYCHHRFSQFFVSPLFTESAVDREVNAVNSEHEKNVQNDYWRLSQLEKSTADPNHDFSKFGTGGMGGILICCCQIYSKVYTAQNYIFTASF